MDNYLDTGSTRIVTSGYVNDQNSTPEPLIIKSKPRRRSFYYPFMMIVLGLAILFVTFQTGSSDGDSEGVQVSVEKQIKLANILGAETKTTRDLFRSEIGGFAVRFDPAFWLPEIQNDDEVTLVLKKEYGSSYFNLKKLGSFEGLDAAVESVVKGNEILQRISGKITNKEKVSFNNYDSYKLTLSLNLLGGSINNYQYVVKFYDSYYLITESASLLLNSAKHLEDLNSSVSFFNSDSENVLAASTSKASDSILDESKITALVKPSVVNIAHLYCQSLNIQVETQYMKPSYKICSGMKGSGFIVNGNGFVATNGHVVKVYPEEMMVLAFLDGRVAPFLIDLIKQISFEQGQVLTDEQAQLVLLEILKTPGGEDALLGGMYSLYDKKALKIEDLGSRYFVRMGGEPFDVDEKKLDSNDIGNAISLTSGVLSASLVGIDFPNSFTSAALLKDETPAGSDVGMLKVNNPEGYLFPALKFADSSTLAEGAQILVVGYPGLVEGSSKGSSLLSYESSVEATITRGIVSSIKTAKDGKKLFQTDASIDHGNSGGPALNQQGEVVGIATYGFQSASGNFNFLRDISDQKDLMSTNNIAIEPSVVFDNWRMGLDNFWANKYKRALPYFNSVKGSYPIHVTVDQYLADSQTAIEKNMDKSGFLAFLPLTESISPTLLIGGFAGLVLIVIGIIVAIAVLKRKPNADTSQTPQGVPAANPVEINITPATPVTTPTVPITSMPTPFSPPTNSGVTWR